MVPHDPQLFGSLPRSTHAPPQIVYVEGQVQPPCTHAGAVEGHTVPHPPQFFASLVVSVHAEPQKVWPAVGQVQLPPEHVCPAAHALPQLPQSWASVCVSTHAAPHSVWPLAGHAHLPALQTATDGHTRPPALAQPPQLFGSVDVFAHRPPQLCVPAPHVHLPPWQTPPLPSADPHSGSVAGASSTMPLQSLSLPSHVSGAYAHWQTLPACPASGPQVQPATQSAVELHDVVQTLPVHPAPPPGG